MKTDILFEDEKTLILATTYQPVNKAYVYDKVNHIMIEATADELIAAVYRALFDKTLDEEA